MRKLLIALSLTLAAATSQAQVSVITESAEANSKTKINNIGTTVQKDLFVIQKKAEDWHRHVLATSENIDISSEQIDEAVTWLTEKNEEFMIKEEDPIYTVSDKTTPTYKDYAKKAVPSCTTEKPRLIYNGTKWVCTPRLTCNEVNGNQESWQETSEDGIATCTKLKAGWFVAGWQGCKSNGKQQRVVLCKYFRNSDGNTPTGASTSFDMCAGPVPLLQRTCAQY